jgi:hypothetical protein
MIIGQIKINNIGKNSIYDNICTLVDDDEMFENACNEKENNNINHENEHDVVIKELENILKEAKIKVNNGL